MMKFAFPLAVGSLTIAVTRFASAFDQAGAAVLADAKATSVVDRTLWPWLVAGIIVAGFLALMAVNRPIWRCLVFAVAVISLFAISPLSIPPSTPEEIEFQEQQTSRQNRGLLGTAAFFGLAIVAACAWGIRFGKYSAPFQFRGGFPLPPANRWQDATSADNEYHGSSYNEVRDAVFANPYPWGRPGEVLPYHPVSIGTLASGLWNLTKPGLLWRASTRSTQTHSDLRWGPDNRGFRRLLHPHGVCLTGEWRITAETPYSGLFATGTRCPIIARYSGEDVMADEARILSIAGKIFPISLDDPQQRDQRVHPANFVVASSLGGAFDKSIFDAKLRSAPDLRPFSSLSGLIKLSIAGLVFMKIDVRMIERPFDSIAQTGGPGQPDVATEKCPRYLQLTAQRPVAGNVPDRSDFREEVLSQFVRLDDQTPPGKLTFKISVAETGVRRGIIANTLAHGDWKEIGEIEFTEAVASYNGDFVIHFPHGKWKK